MEVKGEPGDDWVTITGAGYRIAFQQAPDLQPPDWPDPDRPQQFHLDIRVADVDEAEPKVLELGARRLPGGGGDFRVYADPVGPPLLPGVGRVSADLPSVDLTAASAFVAAIEVRASTEASGIPGDRHRRPRARPAHAVGRRPRRRLLRGRRVGGQHRGEHRRRRPRPVRGRGEQQHRLPPADDRRRASTSSPSRSSRAAPCSSGRCSSPAPTTASWSPAARCGCRTCRCRAPRPAPPGRG